MPKDALTLPLHGAGWDGREGFVTGLILFFSVKRQLFFCWHSNKSSDVGLSVKASHVFMASRNHHH
jgi:hypothetical protein